MRFSVIVPVYNAERYLPECLASLDCQTRKDFEVVLVDDGSSDGSADICDEWAGNRPFTRVIHSENKGTLIARRTGMLAAQGDYVVPLDADDCLRFDAIDQLEKVVCRDLPDMVLFGYSRKLSYEPFGPSLLPLSAGYYGREKIDVLRQVTCECSHNSLWAKVIKKSIIDDERSYEPYQGMTHAEDLFQLCPMVDRAQSFSYSNEAMYYYRQNPTSVTKRYSESQRKDLDAAIERLLAYAQRWGSDCLDVAREGALRQYCYLLHILLCDDLPDDKRRAAFLRLCDSVQERKLGQNANKHLRLDHRSEVALMRSRRYRCALLLVRLEELIKRLGC